MPQVRIRVEKVQEQPGEANVNLKSSADEKKNVAATSIFAHQMMGIGKQVVNYGLRNVGTFTGNYDAQEDINAALDLVSDGSTIALGFGSGGWIGGVIAIVGVGTKRILETVTQSRSDKMSQRQTEYLLERSGNATLDGSRGTEN